jgi:hypothetical protein
MQYNVVDPIIKWLPEERQVKIIKAIPEEHQPIFWFLKYHMRRPSEAMALQRIDYDKEQNAFLIRRTFSNKQMVEYTKTKKQHLIPCHSEFKKIMDKMPVYLNSPHFFVNRHGKLEGKHYQHDYLVDLWHQACKKVGEEIDTVIRNELDSKICDTLYLSLFAFEIYYSNDLIQPNISELEGFKDAQYPLVARWIVLASVWRSGAT